MHKIMLIVMAITLAAMTPDMPDAGNQAMAAGTSQLHGNANPRQQGGDSLGASHAVYAIDAFSDTTSWDWPDTTYSAQLVFDDDDWATKIIDGVMEHGAVAGTIISIVALVFMLVVCALPFLVVILPVIYLIKRSNNKTRLAEKMIENGTPLPQAAGFSSPTGVALMQSGIRQAAVGVGMILMGWIIDITPLTAIGALVAAIGVGKVISARVAGKAGLKDGDADNAENKE